MWNKIILVLEASLLAIGMLTLQSCFGRSPYYGGNPYYGSNYSSNYGPGYTLQPAYGDYDEQRQWHDSNWWASNRRDWTRQHHPEWIASDRHQNQEPRDTYRRPVARTPVAQSRVTHNNDNHGHHDGQRHDQANGNYDHN